MMPGVTVADVARKHGTTRWQIHDWRKQIRNGNLVLPESVAALPMFAELVVADPELDPPASGGGSDIEIIVGDVVIRAGAGADERQMTRAARAVRAARAATHRLSLSTALPQRTPFPAHPAETISMD